MVDIIKKGSKFKVYSVIAEWGAWEDYHCKTIKTFLSKEKAEELLAKKKAKKADLYAKAEKCKKCPLEISPDDVKGYCEDFLDKDYDPEDEDAVPACESKCFDYDIEHFSIVEIEVEG